MPLLMVTRNINAPDGPRPAGAYSQAVEVASATRIVFISGQVGVDLDGTTPEGAAEQARLAWRNLTAQLESAGMGLDNIVKTTIIIPHAADLPSIAAVRGEVLGDRRPASTLFIGVLVNPAWKVEIEAVACA